MKITPSKNENVYEISNKRVMGRTEIELLKDVHNAVKSMIQKELSPIVLLAGPHLKSPEDIICFPEFPKGTKSLLSKFLTKEVWN